ncbi:hypothetical protein EQV77_16080 [Halobacillus fulvus]|nr:hypothetical protein EQV77_16080 [Halobacillus fulvus]
MKRFPLIFSSALMFLSWGLGFYFLSIVTIPTVIIPLPHEFLWMDGFQAFLGLTLLFSLLTIPLIAYIMKKRTVLSKKKSWYSILTVNQLIWAATIASQVKIMAYNLGICH